MYTILHTIENHVQILTESTSIDCNKKNTNAIAFKVVGSGVCTVNSIPVDSNDGFVSFGNSMPVRDSTTYDITVPSGTVVYVVTTNILRAEPIEVFDKNKC